MEIKEQILKELEGIKADLEAKAKDINGETVKNFEEKMEAINKTLTEIKEAKPEVTAEEVKKMREELDVTIKAFDQLQTRLKPGKEVKSEVKPFDVVLKNALEEKTDDLAKLERREIKNLTIEIKDVGDMSTSNVDGTRYGQILQPGVIMQPARKVHIRSLLPGGSVGAGNTYTFMREVGNGEGNPASVSEGSVKPQFDMDLEEADVKIETIAGWVRFTRKAMNNIPGFISWLQARMPQRLLNVEDALLLYGDGVTPNIKGILATGNFVASTSASTILAEKITDDIAELEDTHERSASAILFRPKVIASFYKNKADGSGEYDLPANVSLVGNQLYISGVPAYASTAVTDGDYVVGDFRNGAQLLTQEGMRLEFFEQDGDNVRYNKITARIEETIALPVYGSNYFIKGSYTP